MSLPKRKLMLHFDVNSTILMKDSFYKLPSVQYNIARALAKSSWGRMVQCDQDEGPQVDSWDMCIDMPQWSKPEAPTNTPIKVSDKKYEDLIDYQSYLEQVYPKGGETDEENWQKRIDLVMKFTEVDQPGEKFKNISTKLMQALTLPKGAKECLDLPEDLVEKVRQGLPLWEARSKSPDGSDEEEDEENEDKKQHELSDEEKYLRKCYGEGMYYIVPSFFRTLVFLANQGRDFSVSFRTYGAEQKEIIWEWNQFCEGLHPAFNGKNGQPLIQFNGTRGTKDLRIKSPDQEAVIYRLSDDLEDTNMLTGISQRITDNFQEVLDSIASGSSVYADVGVITNVYQQYGHIQDTMKKSGSMMISEDYRIWADNDWHRECAKLLLIEQADQSVQHIFFDDNANPDEKCIIDIRDIVTKEVMPYKKMLGRYIVKVDPLKVIFEPDYFVKQIEKCEANRDVEIVNLSKGICEDLDQLQDEQVITETEWQKIQKMSNDEYLMRTVLPVLYQGMQTLEQNRPTDPLKYLAINLLKNQHKIKLPPKEDFCYKP